MASILIVVAAPDPSLYGGQATVATTHARHLAKRGHRVTLLTSDLLGLRPAHTRGPGATTQDGYAVHYLHARIPYPHFALVRVGGVADWMRTHAAQFDLAHIHLTREHLPIAAAFAAQRLQLPFVAQMHGNLRRRKLHHRLIDLPFLRPPLRSASRVCALQEVEAAQLRAVEPQARVAILPNGIELPPHPTWQAQRLQSPVVLFVGRMWPEKRVLDVVEAARILKTEGSKLRYRIVGSDSGDGSRAQALCAQYGLTAQFEFLGALAHDAVLREMSEAAIYVQPSQRESFSLTTFEAMGFGIPSIVTTGNEMSGVFRKHDACAVHEPGASGLAEALRALLADPSRARSLSDRGRKLAGHYTVTAAVDRLEQIYRDVIATSGARR